jgi:hypothetical protein
MSRGSSVSKVTVGWTIEMQFPGGAGVFLFGAASAQALGSTQPPIQWVPGSLPGREADHSHPSSDEVKNA